MAELGWKRVSQSKLYHKVQLDALCQNMLKIRPQRSCSPANMGSKNLPGAVAERGWKRTSQSKLYHKVELDADALCQKMLRIRPQGTCSFADMGSKNHTWGMVERGWKRASQSKQYHKVQLDALSQKMLRIRPQGTCSFADMGSKNLPGGVAERGWKRASQSKLYHKEELDAPVRIC